MKRYPSSGPISLEAPVHRWEIAPYVLRESIERGLVDIVCADCRSLGVVGVDFYQKEGFRRPEFLLDKRCTGEFTASVDLGTPEISTKADASG